LKFLEQKKLKVIHEKLQTILGKYGLLKAMIYNWVNEFKINWKFVKTKPSSSRSISVSINDIVKEVLDEVKKNEQISCKVLMNKLKAN